jgi:serine/threonine protein kinase HipA of HipAB toxin-antitoxin module
MFLKLSSAIKKKEGDVQLSLCFDVISCKACNLSFGSTALVSKSNVEAIQNVVIK